jgi:hypothetical protein
MGHTIHSCCYYGLHETEICADGVPNIPQSRKLLCDAPSAIEVAESSGGNAPILDKV